MIDAAVIRREGGDHLVLLIAQKLLLEQLLLQDQPILQLMLLGLGRLEVHHFRHIDAHAEQAKPAVGIGEFRLCGLQVAGALPLAVGELLKEYVGLIHAQRLEIALYNMLGGLGVKDIAICQAHYILGLLLLRVIGKGLVTGEVPACLGVLGKAHGRHIG